MNPDFNNIVHRLKTNKKFCIEVKDHTTGDAIVPVNDRVDGAVLIEKHGSIEQFFSELQAKGIKKIQIQLHKKHGNACVREGIAYDFELGVKEEHSTAIKNDTMPVQGLGTPEAFGLGMPEMINLHVDRSMLHVARQELSNEKQKTERLEKENKELEEKVRQFERSQDTKEFWGGMVKEAVPALAGIFTNMKGLGTPVNEPKTVHTELQGKLIQVLEQAQGMTDEQLMAAYYVLEGYGKKNEDFINELQQLLVQHNFIEDHGENDTN